MKKRILHLATALLIATAAPALAHEDRLSGADWVLAGETGPHAPFLRFDGGRVGGLGGCNRFGASYEMKGVQLSFSPIAATRMACLDGMAKEQAFFTMLGEVKAMKLDGDQLDLLDGKGKVLARFVRRVSE